MKSKMLIGQTLLLAMMSLLSSGLEEQSLMCYNDYIELLMCEWNISSMTTRPPIAPDTNCFVYAKCDNYLKEIPAQGDLVPISSSKPELLKATLKFKGKCLHSGKLKLPVLNVQCGGNVVVEKKVFVIADNVQLHPPENLQMNGANVSWKLGSPHPRKIKSYKFQIQYKPLDLNWEEKKVQSAEQKATYCKLNDANLTLGGQYEIRVRSISGYGSGTWSDWSPSLKWTSTVGKTPPDMMPWLFPSVTCTVIIIIMVILLIFFRVHLSKCSLKSADIQNPFNDLYTIHKGDFKSWLGPIVVTESFVKADTEIISPMELSKAKDLDVSYKKDEDKKRSFSNSTYFLPHSSKGAVTNELEPCSEDCPYGPAGDVSVEEKALLTEGSDAGNESCLSGPLETSSSYKHLQKLRLDVQSPDSGFAPESEDQDSQEESGSEGLPSPPVMDSVLPISHVLARPVPQAAHMVGFHPSPRFEWSPENTISFSVFPSIFIDTLMDNTDFMDCSGMVEPASEDYMPVKAVQD